MSSILIRNGTIVTMDEGRIVTGGAVYVEGQRIVEIGPTAQLAAKYQADKEIDAAGKIVMPGLIDAHYHTCQQFLRGTLSSLTRRGYLHSPGWKHYLIPWEARLSEEDVYLSGLAAYTNMIKVGTTCFSEHGGRYPEQMARAMRQVGIRGLLAESTMDVADPELPSNMVFSSEEAIRRNVELVERYGGRGDDLIRGCFSLRQIIVCTPALFTEFTRLAAKYDALIQMHLDEGTYEIEYTVNRTSLRPAEYLEHYQAMGPRMMFAHAVLMSDHEVELLAKYGAGICHCPSGNMSMLGMTKIPLMRRLGVSIGLGSDGAAGGSIDLFNAMAISLVGQLLALGTPYLDRNAARAYELVEMATNGSARTVRWEDGIGSLKAGKLADIIILDTSSFDTMPVFDDMYYTIVKCLRGNNVETVLVHGQVVMEKRRMLTIDEDELRARIRTRVPQLYDEFKKYLDTQP